MPTETLAAITPAETLMQISGGYSLSRCLHVVADLGVADALDDQPRSAAALAESTGSNADALNRVLRLLSCHGIFESRGGKFAHTPASRLLRSDHPRSMRSFVRMIGLPVNWAAYGKLDHTVRTGQSAMAQVLPDGLFRYFADHPEASQIFNQAMMGKAQAQIAGIVGNYSFSDLFAKYAKKDGAPRHGPTISSDSVLVQYNGLGGPP